MPNVFDNTGLQTLTQNEIVENLIAKFKEIYGDDINVDSNSPDGQIINIFAQMLQDQYELLNQVYSSFDPDQAVGTVLDQRCAINGIQRKAGTYTYVQIDVTTDRSLTLNGLDTYDVEDAYTISDNEGNQFVLANTSNLSAGVTSLRFRAYNIGNVEALPNTITTPVTIVLGVVSVNNPSGPTELGINEETDAELRERRKASVSISNQGYVEGLVAALRNIGDVTSANVYQNRTENTDADGIPGHSIWVVVAGGSDADIGKVMDNKVAGGVGMKGTQSVNVAHSDGSVDTYYFDRPTSELAYVKLDITPLSGQVIIPDEIKSSLANGMSFSPNQPIDSSDIICYIKSVYDNIAVNCQVSKDGTTWKTVETPTSKDKFFYITTASIVIDEES